MTNNLRCGVVGAGFWGTEHVKTISAHPDAEVRWLVDRREDLLADAKGKYPVQNISPDLNDMLQDKGLDLVIIATPPWTHFPIAMEAIKAGKNVLVEKPLCRTVQEARELLAEARKHPDVMVLGATARHARLNPKFTAVKEMIDSGKLGQVYLINHRCVVRQRRSGLEYNPNGKWFLDKSKAGGGQLINWGVYDLAFHLGLVGDPAFVDCTGVCVCGVDKVDAGTMFDVEEHGAAMMTFANGLRYYWERASNAHCDAPNQTVIYGTGGGVRFSYCTWESPEIEYFSVDDDGKGKAQKEIIKIDMEGKPSDMVVFIDTLVGNVLGKKPMPVSIEQEVRNLEIIDAIYNKSQWIRNR